MTEKYIARVLGLAQVEALWFDGATTEAEMVRDMNIVARVDPRVIFVKLFRVRKVGEEDKKTPAKANLYLYAGVPSKTTKVPVQHFFYAISDAEALAAAKAWSWDESSLYACTEVMQ